MGGAGLISRSRDAPDFDHDTDTDDSDHDWRFVWGITVSGPAASACKGSSSCEDPGEVFVAILSGCRMLTFLTFAATKRHVVDSSKAEVVGILARDEAGSLAITKPHLAPGGVIQRGETATTRGSGPPARSGSSRLLDRQLEEDEVVVEPIEV